MPQVDYTLPLDQLPDPLPIAPLSKPFDVTITPPGSKSITCRAYVLAALAEGESKIIRPLRADDTDHLLNALCTLGAEARWEGDDVYIKGVGGRFPRGGNLYMGEGGTPTRFMIACACLAAEPVVIDASPRMRERPIAEGVDMLRQLGAKIEYVEVEGRLPVRVVPSNRFNGGKINVKRTASSQFISALLLIAPCLKEGIETQCDDVPTSSAYVDLTMRVLVDWQDDVLGNIEDIVPEHKRVEAFPLHCSSFQVEPDASSALYWIVAAELTRSQTNICGLNENSAQPDTGPLMMCRLMKVNIRNIHWWDADSFPDGAVAIAVALSMASKSSTITGLRTLRVKETDRISALANELRKVGCTIETGEDWISITPPNANRANPRAEPGAKGFEHAPVVIETYNDHRMAMAFAVLGLNPPNGVPLAIRNPKCVAKSYPGFWKDFAKLYR